MQPSRLDDPDYAPRAWRRYGMLMRWMVLASLLTTLVGLGLLRWMIGPLSTHMIIATSLGMFITVLLASALMGLVFLSSGSGHDESIEDPFKDNDSL